jgi:Leucine-rich repeat (LRR) protein
MSAAAAAPIIAAWRVAGNPAAPLRLNNLGLVYVPLDIPDNVQILLLSDNGLVELPDDLPHTIHTLDVAHNRLTALPSTLPPALHTLFAGYNRLTALPSTLPPVLHTLSVQYNQLRALPDTLVNLHRLTLLVLSHNALTALPSLPPSLLHLRANANWLTVFPTLPDTISEVWLDHNRLTELKGDLPTELTRLSVSNNAIGQIVRLRFNPSLQLWLENNPLPLPYDCRTEDLQDYLDRLTTCMQQQLASWL